MTNKVGPRAGGPGRSQFAGIGRTVSLEVVQDIAYDPGPFLERTTVPMLYVYGSEDINVPTAQCEDRLTELSDTGLPVSYHIIQREGHELGGVGLTGYQFVDGYMELLGEFAEAQFAE